jgi:hypothetical protein
MAVAVIEDVVPRSNVSQVVIAEKDGKFTALPGNGTVTDVAEEGGAIRFTLLAKSLPWVLPPDAAEGATLTHLGHHYSNEKVTVRNLKPGKYEVRIDGQAVGQWTDGQLAFGVEFEGNEKTPQYQQALQVAMLNKRRNDEAYRPIRDQYGALKGKRNALRKATDANAPDLDAQKAAFETWYATQKAQVATLLAKAKGLEDEIYQANQPKPRKYEIAPVAAK